MFINLLWQIFNVFSWRRFDPSTIPCFKLILQSLQKQKPGSRLCTSLWFLAKKPSKTFFIDKYWNIDIIFFSKSYKYADTLSLSCIKICQDVSWYFIYVLVYLKLYFETQCIFRYSSISYKWQILLNFNKWISIYENLLENAWSFKFCSS